MRWALFGSDVRSCNSRVLSERVNANKALKSLLGSCRTAAAAFDAAGVVASRASSSIVTVSSTLVRAEPSSPLASTLLDKFVAFKARVALARRLNS